MRLPFNTQYSMPWAQVCHRPDRVAACAVGRRGWTWEQTVDVPRFVFSRRLVAGAIEVRPAVPPTLARVTVGGRQYVYAPVSSFIHSPLSRQRYISHEVNFFPL